MNCIFTHHTPGFTDPFDSFKISTSFTIFVAVFFSFIREITNLVVVYETVNSLLTDTSLKRTLRLVPAVFSRIPYIKTLYETDTSIRRTTDTYLW